MSKNSEFILPTGHCFYTVDEVSIGLLSRMLCKIAAFIQEIDPEASLTQYDDWWEHDGLHFKKGNLSVNLLFDLVHSPRSLLESTPRDDFVFVGIGPANGQWYLRYRAEWDDVETNIVGRLAFISTFEVAESFRESVLQLLDHGLEEIDTESYYRQTIL